MVAATTLATTNGSVRALIVKESLDQEAEQRKLLTEYVKGQMVEGLDYGVIPGTQKPTLLKPGAEKLTKLFRTTARFNTEKEIEDWDKGLFYYRFKCLIEDAAGNVVAEGIGSANSREARYRWRTASRICPFCKVAAIIKSKFPPRDQPDQPPGWYCNNKKGGCGANFPHDDQSITGQAEGRIENPDIADCINTLQKIAKKRALVDATLGLSLCSDLFTQDLEDTVGDLGTGQGAVPSRPSAQPPAPVKQPENPAGPTADDFLEILKGCKTPASFQAEWNAIPPSIQKVLIPAKDAFKARFAAADKAAADKAAAESDLVGKDLAQTILNQLSQLGIDWGEVTDDRGAGAGLSLVADFTPMLELKVTQLRKEQGLKLHAELKRRLDEKKAGKVAVGA